MEAAQADLGQVERMEAGLDYAPIADHAPAAEQAAVDYGSALEYGQTMDYGPVPDYAAPPMPAPVPAAMPPREDIYAAPVALPGPVDDLPGERDRTAGRPHLAGDLAAYNPGAVREPYQRESMLREAPAADTSDRLQPVPVALHGNNGNNGSAQVRRLPTRSGPGGPNQGQPPLGLPPAPVDAGMGQQPGGQQQGGQLLSGPHPGGQPTSGQPTGGQPVMPVAPVVPMDYSAVRVAPLGGPRHVVQGPGGPGGLGGPGPQLPPGVQAGPQNPPVPQVPAAPPAPPAAPAPGGQPAPGAPQDMGAPAGPIGLAGPGGYSGGTPGVSLADAVQSAHEEGQAFGESVARDAPALWLEAVLARKPRMPSDLEARLLQGSALPIDFLLHDEVRHALRRGFWDALERARR
jgi:hypothetical protein